MGYKELTLIEEIREATGQEQAVLIYFSAPHCNVCKVLKPKVAELLEKEFPIIQLFYVDIDRAPIVSGQFNIFTIPTILVFFTGKETFRMSRNIGLSELENNLRRPYKLLFD